MTPKVIKETRKMPRMMAGYKDLDKLRIRYTCCNDGAAEAKYAIAGSFTSILR